MSQLWPKGNTRTVSTHPSIVAATVLTVEVAPTKELVRHSIGQVTCRNLRQHLNPSTVTFS